MKAMRFYKPHKPLVMEDVAVPKIGPDDVLIDVKACGVCGSDIHIVDGEMPLPNPPVILGHEASGIVAEVGSNVEVWKPGDRAAIAFIISCGICYNCLAGRETICTNKIGLGGIVDGGMAEYERVPAKNLIRLPENVPFDVGAVITDAVTTPFHALVKRGSFQMGQTLAVYGLGGLGYHGVLLGLLAGASKVFAVDVNLPSLERAKAMGADVVINGAETDPVRVIRDMTGGKGVDVALEFVGTNKTIDQTIRSVRIGGKAVLVGVGLAPLQTVPPAVSVRQELEILGSYAMERTEIETIIDLTASGRLDMSKSVTERLPLEQANVAIEHLRNKVGNPVRIVLTQD